MTSTSIDIVMKDLSFLDDVHNESMTEEQTTSGPTQHEQSEQPSAWHRLAGFMRLVK